MAASAEQVLATLTPREQQLIQDPTLPEDSKVALMSGLGMSAADIVKVLRRYVDVQTTPLMRRPPPAPAAAPPSTRRRPTRSWLSCSRACGAAAASSARRR